MLFPPGDAAFLASLVERAWAQPDEMSRMGQASLNDYKTKYTPRRNYELLRSAYE